MDLTKTEIQLIKGGEEDEGVCKRVTEIVDHGILSG